MLYSFTMHYPDTKHYASLTPFSSIQKIAIFFEYLETTEGLWWDLTKNSVREIQFFNDPVLKPGGKRSQQLGETCEYTLYYPFVVSYNNRLKAFGTEVDFPLKNKTYWGRLDHMNQILGPNQEPLPSLEQYLTHEVEALRKLARFYLDKGE